MSCLENTSFDGHTNFFKICFHEFQRILKNFLAYEYSQCQNKEMIANKVAADLKCRAFIYVHVETLKSDDLYPAHRSISSVLSRGQ